MSQIDVIDAKKALATRLTMWGIPPTEAGKHAAGFIDDLVARGWQMAPHRETRPHPPKPHEDCPHHPGQWAANCGGCAADRAAADGPETPPRAREPGDAAVGAAAVRAQIRPMRTFERTEDQ